MEQKKIGEIIKRQRLGKALTQAELAEESGVSTNYIGDIEKGRKIMGLDVFFRLADALAVRPDYLLSIYFGEKEVFCMQVKFEKIKLVYQLWKELNEIIANDLGSRKVNLPEAISENLVCYALGYTRNMNGVGDATDQFGNLIEIKATANFNSDLSSFSPNTNFDKLIFVRLNIEEDKAYIYDLGLNGFQFGKLYVNKTETVLEQQQKGRRPRLSLIEYIDEHGLQPVKVLDLS